MIRFHCHQQYRGRVFQQLREILLARTDEGLPGVVDAGFGELDGFGGFCGCVTWSSCSLDLYGDW